MTRTDPVLARLRDLVAKRDAAGEQRLPPERELAMLLKTSRGTLRRALDLLEAEGVLWRHVGQGTFIGSRRPLPQHAAITRFTNPDEVMEARLMLEPQLAAMAAIRGTGEDVARMDNCVRKSEAAVTTATFELWDGRLHRAIAEAARNRMLLALFDHLNAVRDEDLWGQLKKATVTRTRKAGYRNQHRALVDAIRKRDAVAAEKIMRAHLDAVRRDLLAPVGSKAA
jgi:DNA-binding FadR family transcriptional regulator